MSIHCVTCVVIMLRNMMLGFQPSRLMEDCHYLIDFILLGSLLSLVLTSPRTQKTFIVVKVHKGWEEKRRESGKLMEIVNLWNIFSI